MEKWSSLRLPQGKNISIPDCAVQIDRCLPANVAWEGQALLCADGCPPANMAQKRAGTALWRRPSLFLQEPDLVQHLELVLMGYRAWPPVAGKAEGGCSQCWGLGI